MNTSEQAVQGSFCSINGKRYYRIANFDQMAPFFMSLVSGYDHWCFIASNGGLSAGRQNATKALFPYYTEDKLIDNAANTGGVTAIRVNGELWRPLQPLLDKAMGAKRYLYKTATGDELIFEESWQNLRLRVAWTFSEAYGLIRRTELSNLGSEVVTVEIVDGLLNVLPAQTPPDSQVRLSNLLDAYKNSEVLEGTLAAYSYSSLLTDLAEPAEALKANVVWSTVPNAKLSLAANSLHSFCQGQSFAAVDYTRGQRGAYLLHQSLELAANSTEQWTLAAEVELDQVQVAALLQALLVPDLVQRIADDCAASSDALRQRVAKSDGLQNTGCTLSSEHHYANCLFNIMRGGMFERGYEVSKTDVLRFIRERSRGLEEHPALTALADSLLLSDLHAVAQACGNADLQRLLLEYIPVSFSRRHGDPSRPWNQFSINLKDEFGDEKLDFQGNWRDIFQNWEPLGLSYPLYLPSMISTFLNATTLDGYNPYRVTRQGIEWEEPEPDNPWANIGYWGDHQIIYLSKLLEVLGQTQPERLQVFLNGGQFSYADVPYRIKDLAALLDDPQNSILFDEEANATSHARAQAKGGDGKLIHNGNAVLHGTLLEKLATLWIAKLSNLVPDGGIWMNTQRPEWNDANNALVGWGLSVVTTCYLHRHLKHMRGLLAEMSGSTRILQCVATAITELTQALKGAVHGNPESRYQAVLALGQIGERFRHQVYQRPLTVEYREIPVSALVQLLDTALPVLEQTIRANRRDDGLYHAYNLLHINGEQAGVLCLDEMLEGQVAVLSAELLDANESLQVFTALPQSALFRNDQHTYLLYPNKQLAGFLAKNVVADTGSELARTLIADSQCKVLQRDAKGQVRFSADFRKVADLKTTVSRLRQEAPYRQFSEDDWQQLYALYEATFNHKAFTGRSGCFYGYEGLGSTYWHMVSKLLLAAQECWLHARASGAAEATVKGLYAAFYDVRQGIGFNKSPAEYGAFPTDPYSHTPETGLAKQPGMTGQVKEELLTRQIELGLRWQDGELLFDAGLLREQEFLTEPQEWRYLDLNGEWQSLELQPGELAFTLCQVPVVVRRSGNSTIESEAGVEDFTGDYLPATAAQQLLRRDGRIKKITLSL